MSLKCLCCSSTYAHNVKCVSSGKIIATEYINFTLVQCHLRNTLLHLWRHTTTIHSLNCTIITRSRDYQIELFYITVFSQIQYLPQVVIQENVDPC